MNILQILNDIENTSSSNDKIKLLKEQEHNELFRLVVETALDKKKKFYIKKIPHFTSISATYEPTIDFLMAILNLSKLSNRELTGHAAQNYLVHLLSNLRPCDAEVLTRIVLHDLRCGISTKSTNKAWGNVIEEYPHMLAGKDRKAIKYPAIAQLKLDGVFAHASRKGDKIHFYTRKGNEMFINNDELEADLLQVLNNNETLTGELTCVDEDGNTLKRKKIAGIMLKAQQKNISEKESKQTTFTAWDLNDYTSTIPYEVRWRTLLDRFNENSIMFYTSLTLVQSKDVYNEEEVLEWYARVLEEGKEGLVVKNLEGKWTPKRSNDLCKFKAEKICELRVIAYRFGNGKYENMLGSMTCASEDGKLLVDVGSGFSDNERRTIAPSDILDKIIEVKYNEIITDVNHKHSLFLPVYGGIRFDKSKADNLKDIK